LATRVIIVRHGQSSYNAQKRIQGRSDESVLTEKGQLDAKTVGKTLSGLDIDGIFCSPLQRAKLTAEIIQSCFASPPSLTATPDLLEIDLALWENWYKKDVIEKFPEEYQCWQKRPQDFKMTIATPEGQKETFPVVDLYHQAQGFWQKLLSEHQNKTLLIVAHNGINRCLIMIPCNWNLSIKLPIWA
jgi:probable phosphoglycerate mutase